MSDLATRAQDAIDRIRATRRPAFADNAQKLLETFKATGKAPNDRDPEEWVETLEKAATMFEGM